MSVDIMNEKSLEMNNYKEGQFLHPKSSFTLPTISKEASLINNYSYLPAEIQDL